MRAAGDGSCGYRTVLAGLLCGAVVMQDSIQHALIAHLQQLLQQLPAELKSEAATAGCMAMTVSQNLVMSYSRITYVISAW